MNNREFSGLLRRAANIAKRAQAVQQELTEAFTERYGTTYSDVDADSIIDVLDYGGGRLSVAECDQIMANYDAPRIDVDDPA